MLRSLLLFVVVGCTSAEPRLVKVVVLGRHGNRCSNAEAAVVCPGAAAQIKWLRKPTWEAALTGLGETQCELAGDYLRQHYVFNMSFLTHPRDDHSTFFFAENADRNVACVSLAQRALYPRSTQGLHHPILPVLTTTPGHDTLMNIVKNGPCIPADKKEQADWAIANEPRIKRENAELLKKLGGVCGFDFFSLEGGNHSAPFAGQTLVWGLKAVMDLLEFARYEGMDYTLGGRWPLEDFKRLHILAQTMIDDSSFASPRQITKLVGDFPEKAMFTNMERPDPKEMILQYEVQGIAINKAANPWQPTPLEFYYHNKFLVFWNHRELMSGILKMFGGKYVDGTEVSHLVGTGGMILWEVWEEDANQFIRYFQYELDKNPRRFSDRSLPWPHIRREAQNNMASVSTRREIFPSFCNVKGRCTLQEFKNRVSSWEEKTGDWRSICGISSATACTEKVQEEAIASLPSMGPTSTSPMALCASLTTLAMVSAVSFSLGRQRRVSVPVADGYYAM